jgi:hypothetical protein
LNFGFIPFWCKKFGGKAAFMLVKLNSFNQSFSCFPSSKQINYEINAPYSLTLFLKLCVSKNMGKAGLVTEHF